MIKSETLNEKRGFTLIELLVVIGIIAILFAVVLVAVNPAQRFAQTRDARRITDVNSILNAILNATVDSKGTLPGNLGGGADGTAGNSSPYTATITNDTIVRMIGNPASAGAGKSNKTNAYQCGGSNSTSGKYSLFDSAISGGVAQACASGSTCDTYDLDNKTATGASGNIVPSYLASMPIDPGWSSYAATNTGYAIQNANGVSTGVSPTATFNGRIKVVACTTERDRDGDGALDTGSGTTPYGDTIEVTR